MRSRPSKLRLFKCFFVSFVLGLVFIAWATFPTDPVHRRDIVLSFGNILSKIGIPGTLADYYGIFVKHAVLVQTKESYLKHRGYQNAKNPRLLCWITSYHGTRQKANAVRQSWGRDCDKFLIMYPKFRAVTEKEDAVSLPVSYHYSALWNRTQLALLHLWTHFGTAYDFILKADDDTLVNVKNLRKFLYGFSPDDTLYIGHPLHIPTLGTYMSGGAGYTITRQSLSLLIQAFNRSGPNFLQDSIPEDAALGLLLASIGATFIATVDLQNRLMSLPVRMTHYNGSQVANWYTMANSALMSDGSLHERFQCCSDTMISRHYISPENMFQGMV